MSQDTPPCPPTHGRTEPVDIQHEMQRSLHRLRDERHRRARAARRPRRPQAGAPPGAVRDVRLRLPPGPRLREVLPGRRRRHGQLPPARRLVDLRHPGPAGPAVVAALPAGRRPGQLRLAGQRPGGCHAIHRVPDGPLAMEMVRDIDQDTVDFKDNYDGKTQEPTVLPSRFPNLLVNGSAGIAVGMATNIPPHNLREVAAGVQWFLENPEATRRGAARRRDGAGQGPDFPTGALIVGRDGIEDAYRTGRGSIRMRAVVEVEEDSRGPARRWSSPSCRTRSTRTTSRRRSPSWSRTASSAASPTSATRRRPHRPAPGHRAQARRGRQGGAEQPLQAHPAAGHVRREHARARRRGAAHACGSTQFIRLLRRAPGRGHRPAHR